MTHHNTIEVIHANEITSLNIVLYIISKYGNEANKLQVDNPSHCFQLNKDQTLHTQNAVQTLRCFIGLSF